MQERDLSDFARILASAHVDACATEQQQVHEKQQNEAGADVASDIPGAGRSNSDDRRERSSVPDRAAVGVDAVTPVDQPGKRAAAGGSSSNVAGAGADGTQATGRDAVGATLASATMTGPQGIGATLPHTAASVLARGISGAAAAGRWTAAHIAGGAAAAVGASLADAGVSGSGADEKPTTQYCRRHPGSPMCVSLAKDTKNPISELSGKAQKRASSHVIDWDAEATLVTAVSSSSSPSKAKSGGAAGGAGRAGTAPAAHVQGGAAGVGGTRLPSVPVDELGSTPTCLEGQHPSPHAAEFTGYAASSGGGGGDAGASSSSASASASSQQASTGSGNGNGNGITCCIPLRDALWSDHRKYRGAAEERSRAMEALMWDEGRGQWSDLLVEQSVLPFTEPSGEPKAKASTPEDRGSQAVPPKVSARYRERTDLVLGSTVRHSPLVSASDFTPLWAGLGGVQSNRTRAALVAKTLRTSGLVAPGGVFSTLARTPEQWDWPNAWAPVQHMIILGLNSTQEPTAMQLGADLARRWLNSGLVGYLRAGYNYEKYNAQGVGVGGGGGEKQH